MITLFHHAGNLVSDATVFHSTDKFLNTDLLTAEEQQPIPMEMMTPIRTQKMQTCQFFTDFSWYNYFDI